MHDNTLRRATATFTRPNDTTAYAQGDLIANSTTNTLVTPLTFSVGKYGINVKGIQLQKSTVTVANSEFFIDLFSTSPIVANGDNGALSVNLSQQVGRISLGATLIAATDGAYIALNNSSIHAVATASGVLFGLLSANAAYAPGANEVFTVGLIYQAL